MHEMKYTTHRTRCKRNVCT